MAFLGEFFLGGLALLSGVLCVRFYLSRAQKDIQLREREHQLEQIQIECSELREKNTQLEKQNHLLDKNLETKNVQFLEQTKALQEKIEFIDRAKTELEKNFKALANDISQKALAQLNAQNNHEIARDKDIIANMLKPVAESVTELRKHVAESSQQRSNLSGKLDQSLHQLFLTHQNLDRELKGLQNALKRPQTRGRWGEIQLHRIVELAGMQEYVDFEEQKITDGKNRPDMTILLPGERKIAVDAKASMDAYLKALEANTDEERDRLLQQHASQVILRVRDLGKKEYWKSTNSSFDYVVLFLPLDSLYACAVEKNPNLIEDAIQQHVLIASPMTLMALLRTISCTWSEFASNKEAEKIVALGHQFIERFSNFAKHLQDIGKFIDNSTKAYNNLVGSFDHHLRPTLEKFSQLQSLQHPEVKELIQIDTKVHQLDDKLAKLEQNRKSE